MSWNPDTYLAFASERTRPAADLLARVALDKPQRIVDLGCGPGNSTALLAGCWPAATVEGVDSSPEMIARAKESGVHAGWSLHDVAAWAPERRYDLVFSNATYQWLPDHRALLPRLMGFVAKGGVFAFQVPNNHNAPSHAAMRETAADGPWAAKLKDVRGVSVETPATYYDILAPHAAARHGSVDIWTTDYFHILDGEDAVFRWVSGTGLRPYLDALAPDEREAFTTQYKTRLDAAYPRRRDGRTLLPFSRLFAVARV